MKHMAIRAASAFVILSVLVVQSVSACLWDRDTLAMEAEHFPGITEIITGRFDRFPPLYYEMRLERVAKELETDPDNLELYDDAGVASDRLGRHDEAIEWMAKKRSVLDSLDSTDAEHEYRYLANLGTFHIHRWLSNGANREDLTDAELARDLIAHAIELNPDAHFGRERYQLLAIEWILNGYTHSENEWHMPTIIEQIDGYPTRWDTRQNNSSLSGIGYADAIEGLSGLIAIGNAWQSVDVFYALSLAFYDQEHHVLQLVCQMRVKELIETGHRSLSPEFDHESYLRTDRLVNLPIGSAVPEPYDKEIAFEYFPAAREEAADWVDRRVAYMNQRLARGEHPDTDASFWSEWIESTSPPEYPSRLFVSRYPAATAILVFVGLICVVFVALCVAFWKHFKRRSAQPA